MESLLLILLVAVVTPASLECVDNCTDPVPIFSIHFGSFFPRLFGPADVDPDHGPFDDAIDPFESLMNNSQQPEPQGGELSINFMQIIAMNKGDSDSSDELDAQEQPELHFLIQRRIIFRDPGILDLSGQNLTGGQLESQLLSRPVTSLVLSNSRLHNVTADTFRPAANTLRELYLDNCSVPLHTLSKLTNLRVLSLSNTGLSEFPWFFQWQDSLEVLDLSHNGFKEVSPQLSTLTNLRSLNLSYNSISSVEEFPLSLLPKLEVLSLTMNSLSDATFTSLQNLQLLELDWNYLWRAGYEMKLPAHKLDIRLASNPWRCDCGLLEARDSHHVLDLDQLQCANRQSFSVCNGCRRYFLPLENGRHVAELDHEAIEYLDCTGVKDRFYQVSNALSELREKEPEKLATLGILLLLGVMVGVASFMLCRMLCSKKKFDRKSWLKVQQIPQLSINKLKQPNDVPYDKMDEPITV